VNTLNNPLKEILISILEYSILNIRTASNNKDFKLISYELEHLPKLIDLLMDVRLLKDYMQSSIKKYLEQIKDCYENPIEDLWNELQNIFENQTQNVLILDEMDMVLIKIVSIGIKNISSFMAAKDYRNIFIEAYHIHNIPNIITSKKKEEMIDYYLRIERKQYLKEGDRVARQNFESVWKEFFSIIKPKKRFIFF